MAMSSKHAWKHPFSLCSQMAHLYKDQRECASLCHSNPGSYNLHIMFLIRIQMLYKERDIDVYYLNAWSDFTNGNDSWTSSSMKCIANMYWMRGYDIWLELELELEFLSSIKRPILTYGTKVYMCSWYVSPSYDTLFLGLWV